MGIDKALYLTEMQKLLKNAHTRWRKQHGEVEVYSINIWTDPTSRASAVNFDTREHSKTTVAHA